MDERLREPLRTTRLLAWAVAGLLVAGAVSAGAVAGGQDAADTRIVAAAGQNADGVEVPTTTMFVPPVQPPVAPPPTVFPSTTTSTAPRPAPTAAPTTQPPRTTTTKAPATAAPVSAGVTLNVVNEHTFAVAITVNGRSFTLAPGEQSGPTAITRYAHGNDIVEVRLVQEPSCGMGDAYGYFPSPGGYRMAVVASKGLCQAGMPGPEVRVTPA